MSVKRGDIYYADLSPVIGSEQGGQRPVLIIQNDVGNKYSPTVIAAAITSRMGKTRLPTHIDIHAEKVGLAKDSVILLEQVRTLDKRRLKEKMGHLDDNMMSAVNNAISISFGLGDEDVFSKSEKITMGFTESPNSENSREATVQVPGSAVARADYSISSTSSTAAAPITQVQTISDGNENSGTPIS